MVQQWRQSGELEGEGEGHGGRTPEKGVSHVHRYVQKDTPETMVGTERGNLVGEDRRIFIVHLYLWISLLLNVITQISTKHHIHTGSTQG